MKLVLVAGNNVKIEKPVAKYTVTYNANGGTGEVPNSVTQKENTVVLVDFETLPTKEGYDFVGWATAEKAKEAEYTFTGRKEFTLGENVTLYAVWMILNYQIEYNLEGGSVLENPTTYTVESSDITLKKPIKHGYDFVGWTGSNGTTAELNLKIAKGSTGNKTYTANWKPEYIGGIADYHANGVEDWRIFLDDGTNIYLIASDYVPVSGLILGNEILTNGDYGVGAQVKLAPDGDHIEAGTLRAWLCNESYWTEYATGFDAATALGGPTLSQVTQSYNMKYNESRSFASGSRLPSDIVYDGSLYVSHIGKWEGVNRILVELREQSLSRRCYEWRNKWIYWKSKSGNSPYCLFTNWC